MNSYYSFPIQFTILLCFPFILAGIAFDVYSCENEFNNLENSEGGSEVFEYSYNPSDSIYLIYYLSINDSAIPSDTLLFLDTDCDTSYQRKDFESVSMSFPPIVQELKWNCSIARWELNQTFFGSIAYSIENTVPNPPCISGSSWILTNDNITYGLDGSIIDSIALIGDCIDIENSDPIQDADVCGDMDSDGIKDFLDNCVFAPNPEQEDEDDDGQGDLCDYKSETSIGINTTNPSTDFHISDSQVFIDNPYKGIIMRGTDSLCYQIIVINGSIELNEVTCP